MGRGHIKGKFEEISNLNYVYNLRNSVTYINFEFSENCSIFVFICIIFLNNVLLLLFFLFF